MLVAMEWEQFVINKNGTAMKNNMTHSYSIILYLHLIYGYEIFFARCSSKFLLSLITNRHYEINAINAFKHLCSILHLLLVDQFNNSYMTICK